MRTTVHEAFAQGKCHSCPADICPGSLKHLRVQIKDRVYWCATRGSWAADPCEHQVVVCDELGEKPPEDDGDEEVSS